MKQIYIKFSMLLLCMVVGMSAWADTYTKITSLDGLEAGANYLIVYESSTKAGKAMTTTATTTSTKRLTPADVTISNNSINTSATNIVWTLSGEKDAWMFNNGTNYLNGTGAGAANCTGTSTTGNKYDITVNTDGTFHIQIHNNADRVLEYNVTGPYFAHYKSTQEDVCLYKKVSSSSYSVTANTSATQNGTVSADKTSAAVGATVTLTATPNEGYEVEDFYVYYGTTTVTCTKSGNTATFTMPANNVLYYATFKAVSSVTAPTFDVATGEYKETQLVLVSNYNNNLMYFYTTDGSSPDCDENLDATGTSKLYDNDGGIEISNTTTLKMIAVDEDRNKSSVTTATYTFKLAYSVTIVTPENGTLTVKNGETDVVSGSTYYAGDIISITATPNEGYKFRNLQVTDATTHTYTASNTKEWTMGEASITIKANFDEIKYYDITWSVNGTTSTTSVEDGTAITFPEAPAAVNGKKFVGWVSEEIEGATDTKPTFISSAKASGEVTYYAVFANAVEGSSETATLSCTATSENTKYEKTTVTDNKGNTWNLYTNIAKQDVNNVSHYYFGLNSNNNGYNISSPTFPSSIISVKANVWNTSSSKTRYAYLCSSNETAQPKEGDLGAMTIATSTKNMQQAFELVEDADFKQFYIYASTAGTVGFESIEVTYGTPTTYSDYCTTIPTAYSLTISAAEYATYYDSKNAYVMPEDCEGYVFTVGKGLESAYDGGDVVPAGEPLVIYTIEPGTKTLTFTTSEEETYKSGDMNDLEGTDEETALEEDATSYFYALSLDKDGKNVGFYWMNATGAAFTNGAHKAYLKAAKSATEARGFAFNGATAIKAITTSSNDKIYDLTGREVKSAKTGLYIVNGVKKYIK